MKNFVQEGDRVVVAAPEAADSGEFLVVGQLFGVAEGSAESGGEVVLVRKGVFELPKEDGTAWVQGDQLYWDASAKVFTKTAGANAAIGKAFAAAASGDLVGYVLLERGAPDVVNTPVAGVADGYKVARGETALDASNPTPVATGLTTVISFAAALKGTAAPGVGTSVLTANIAGAAGNVDVYAWKPTSNSDPTLIASTGTESFYWVAVGT